MAYQGPNKRPELPPTAGKIFAHPHLTRSRQIRNPKGVGYGADGPQPS